MDKSQMLNKQNKTMYGIKYNFIEKYGISVPVENSKLIGLIKKIKINRDRTPHH